MVYSQVCILSQTDKQLSSSYKWNELHMSHDGVCRNEGKVHWYINLTLAVNMNTVCSLKWSYLLLNIDIMWQLHCSWKQLANSIAFTCISYNQHRPYSM